MKTPLEKAISLFDLALPEDALKRELEILLQQEKHEIVEAWINGNREGWSQNTDWPEDAERYYNKRFKKATT